jgi:hypothetical protein
MTKHEFFYAFEKATGKSLKSIIYSFDNRNLTYNITAFLVFSNKGYTMKQYGKYDYTDTSNMLVLEGESSKRKNLYCKEYLNDLIKLCKDTIAYNNKLKEEEEEEDASITMS